MSYPIQHGGGKPSKLVVPINSLTVIEAQRDNRRYIEIQNDSGGNRVHLAISDEDDAEWDIGLYLDPGGVYTMNSTNLSPARITCYSQAGTNLYIQPGK